MPHFVLSQKEITKQNLAWVAFNFNLNFNNKWSLQSEIQERIYVQPFAQHQFVLRSHLHRTLGTSNWEVSAGMCLFLQSPNDPSASNKLIIPELRPHIEALCKQQFNSWGLEHRYRAEARFFHQTNATKTELEDGFDFGNFRFRYRLQAYFQLIEFNKNSSLRVKVADEIHLNAGQNIIKNVFDQNRISVDLAWLLNPSLQIELGYLNWFQQTPSATFFNRNIVRLSFTHRLNLKEN